MFLKSHNYMINLDNVDQFKGFVHESGKHGTVFTMNNGKYLQVTCPYQNVVQSIASSEINQIVVELDYGDKSQ